MKATKISGLNIQQEFPSLLNGLGKILGEHHIRVQDNVKPFALSTPRRVPIPLLGKVKAELDHMLEIGVVSRITDFGRLRRGDLSHGRLPSFWQNQRGTRFIS